MMKNYMCQEGKQASFLCYKLATVLFSEEKKQGEGLAHPANKH